MNLAKCLTHLARRHDSGKNKGELVISETTPVVDLEDFGLPAKWINTLERSGVIWIRQLPTLESLTIKNWGEQAWLDLETALDNMASGRAVDVQDASVISLHLSYDLATKLETIAKREQVSLKILCYRLLEAAQ